MPALRSRMPSTRSSSKPGMDAARNGSRRALAIDLSDTSEDMLKEDVEDDDQEDEDDVAAAERRRWTQPISTSKAKHSQDSYAQRPTRSSTRASRSSARATQATLNGKSRAGNDAPHAIDLTKKSSKEKGKQKAREVSLSEEAASDASAVRSSAQRKSVRIQQTRGNEASASSTRASTLRSSQTRPRDSQPVAQIVIDLAEDAPTGKRGARGRTSKRRQPESSVVSDSQGSDSSVPVTRKQTRFRQQLASNGSKKHSKDRGRSETSQPKKAQHRGRRKESESSEYSESDNESEDEEESNDSDELMRHHSSARTRGSDNRREKLRGFVVSDSDSEEDEDESSSASSKAVSSKQRKRISARRTKHHRVSLQPRKTPLGKSRSKRSRAKHRRLSSDREDESDSESSSDKMSSDEMSQQQASRRSKKRMRKGRENEKEKLPHLYMALPALDNEVRDEYCFEPGLPVAPDDERRVSEFVALRQHRSTASYGLKEDEEGSEDMLADSEEEMRVSRSTRATRRAKAFIASISDDDLDSDTERLAAMEPRHKHWDTCACGSKPSHLILRKLLRQRERLLQRGESHSRRRYADELSPLDLNEEAIQEMEDTGGWLECSSCTASLHWSCLAPARQRRILADVNVAEKARCQALNTMEEYEQIEGFAATEMLTTIECDNCFHAYGWRCIICDSDRDMNPLDQVGLLFRCKRCFRACHYECLQHIGGDETVNEAALARQTGKWKCMDCESWGDVEQIIAWRASQTTEAAAAREQAIVAGQPNAVYTASDDLSRDYLIKFKDQSYRETQWVPHRWLKIVSSALLSNFLKHGSGVELEGEKSTGTTSGIQPKRVNFVADELGEAEAGPPLPTPDAQERLPSAWKTPERILDVYFQASFVGEDYTDLTGRRSRRAPSTQQQYIAEKFRANKNLVHVDDVDEDRLDPANADAILKGVAKCLVKWQDLDYQRSTWESVPDIEDNDFNSAFKNFLESRLVENPDFKPRQRGLRYQELYEQPEYIVGGELLDFQLEGLNWLRHGWITHQPKILADEMGLGKTIQIISFVGSLHHEYGRGPVLVVVPNSTLPNWLREFERWLPSLRVVPFWGGKDSRAVIEQYELFHTVKKEDRQPLKAHVVITSESTARLSLDVLRRVPEWEALIVDEGQSLKGGEGGLLYKKLSDLNTVYRVLMTGTPLNNNITELFHLLKFLKPGDEWDAIGDLRRKFEVLTPELVEELQTKLKPFFLRRLKHQVANLPPKVEMFVPVSLKPVQKRIYKSILESNIKDIQALVARKRSKDRRKKAVTSLNNILMQLRKCIQHPYLIAPDLGDFDLEEGIEEAQEHERLILASAKMTLLRQMLPKLKARGHRVLIFSQLVIHLELVEAFVQGEGYSYLRLDGKVGQRQRQKGIDAFNAPDSDVFLYLLSTRAGGVGINLASADTVIMLDPDFNPHVDMQAISRAHRIGQTKRVLVFKLVTKMTAEQRIIDIARKKLVLDHLIVQNLDNETSSRTEDVEDILRFGAKALFDADGTEANDRDIWYNDDEVEDLITRVETEEVEAEAEMSDPLGALALPTVFEQPAEDEDEEQEHEAAESRLDIGDADFWEELLASSSPKKDVAATDATEEATGRGKRVRKPVQRFQYSTMVEDDEMEEVIPILKKRKKKKATGQTDEGISAGSESSDESFNEAQDHRSESPDEFEAQVVNDRRALSEGGNSKHVRYPQPPAAPARGAKLTRTEVTDEAFAILTRMPYILLREIFDATGAVPEAPAPGTKPQLTSAHCRYFSKVLYYPLALFRHAFTLVEPNQLPPQVLQLPDQGARLLNQSVVASHLSNAARRALAEWRKVASHYRQDLERPSYHQQQLNELRVLLMVTDSGQRLSYLEAERFREVVQQIAVPDLDVQAETAVRIPDIGSQHQALQRIFWRVENEFAKQKSLLSSQLPKIGKRARPTSVNRSPFAQGNVKVSFTDFTVRHPVRKAATEIVTQRSGRPSVRRGIGGDPPGTNPIYIDENGVKKRRAGRPPRSMSSMARDEGTSSLGNTMSNTRTSTPKKKVQLSAQERALAAAGLLHDGTLRDSPVTTDRPSSAVQDSGTSTSTRPPLAFSTSPGVTHRQVSVSSQAPATNATAVLVSRSQPQPNAPARPASTLQQSSTSSTSESTDAPRRKEICFVCEDDHHHYIARCPVLDDPAAARARYNYLYDGVMLDAKRSKEERQRMRRQLIFFRSAMEKRGEAQGLRALIGANEIV